MPQWECALDDANRMAALCRTSPASPPMDSGLDRLSRLAARCLNAPVALAVLVEGDRFQVKGSVGLPEPAGDGPQTALFKALGTHFLSAGEPLSISDLRAHSEPAVVAACEPLGLIACATVTLTTGAEGLLGSVAVFDRTPRQWAPDELSLLTDLAASAVTEIRLRFATGGPTRSEAGPWGDIDREPLSESEARERRLLETSHEGIVQVDPDTRVVYVNERIAELVGCPREEILGAHLFQFVHPEDHEALKKGRERRTHGQRDSYDLRLLRPDGSVVYTILNASPITDAEGRFAGALGMFTDVTDRCRAEERSTAFQALGLQLNEARTPEAAARVVLNVADRLLGWDCCWLELGDPEGQSGRTTVLMDLVDGRRVDVPSPCEDMFTTPLVQRVIHEGPLAIFREPGEVPPRSGETLRFGDTERRSGSILCVPIRSHGRPVGAMSIQSYSFHAYTADDLTLLQSLAEYCAGALVRTQAEAAREQLQQQLLHAQKMEAVGRLAGGVAHDFNNMLAVINGYANLLLTRNELADPLRLALREIHRAGERAADLTRQLLAFSRKQILDPQVLDLNRIVHETETMLRRMIGEDVELVVRLDRALGRIKADPTQVEQILVNLAVNARDAMPTGGRLIVETMNVELDALFVRAHAELAPGPYVLLSVADSGCGMPPDVLARIWEPFFTTKGVGEGTGLGLATIYGIVQQSGGHVEVQSEPNRGSTFRVYLPRVVSASPDPDADDPAAPLSGSETVLVVEDEPMVRDLVRNVLELSGYTVLQARHGQDALDVARSYGGTIDILLTDVVMPGGSSGGAVAERLTALLPGLKVLFMSGYTEDAVVRRGIRHEGTAFIRKPFTHAELTQKLRELLATD